MENNTVVEIRPSFLRQQIDEGMKLKPLAEFYNLPVAQMKKVLQQLGLRIRQFHSPKFVIVDEDTTPQPIENTSDVVVGNTGTIPVEEQIAEVSENQW